MTNDKYFLISTKRIHKCIDFWWIIYQFQSGSIYPHELEDCHRNIGRMSGNDEKLPCLHELSKRKFLVNDKNMGLCLYILIVKVLYETLGPVLLVKWISIHCAQLNLKCFTLD